MLVSDVFYDRKNNPIDLERLFRIPGYKCEAKFERVNEELGAFEIVYLDGEDEGFSSIQFSLTTIDEEDLPEMPIFSIEDISSEGGMATKIFGKVVELAKRSGIERMEVNSIQVGAYFWGRVGFLPVEEEFVKLAKKLSEKTKGEVSFSTVDEFKQLVKSEVGKKALLNTDWYGYFDLNDREQMSFCDEYMSSKLQR